MKTVFAFVLLILACVASAQAGSLKIGDTVINFDPPAGYILAEGEDYAEPLSLIAEGMPDTAEVRAVYVERGAAERFLRGSAGFDTYLVIATIKSLDNARLGLKDFKEFKNVLTKNSKWLDDGLATHNKRSEERNNGLGIDAAAALGAYGVTDTSLSILATMRKQVAGEDGELVEQQLAVMSTSLLAQGKLIMLNHYQVVTSPEDMEAFKAHAPQVAAGMHIAQGPATGAAGKSQKRAGQERSGARSAGNLVGGALLAVLIVVLIGLRLRSASKKKARLAASQRDGDAVRDDERK